jgi:flagellar hook-basal body complex protein FliE
MVDLSKIQSIGVPQNPAQPASAAAAQPNAGVSFKDMLLKSLNEVNNLQQDADKQLEDWSTGKTQNPGQVMIAAQKANMAFSMLVQIRNKLQDAYDEVKNLKV